MWLPRSHVGWEGRGTSEVEADPLWAALALFPAHLLLTHSATSRRVIPGPLGGPRGPASSEGLLLVAPPLFPGKLELSEGAGWHRSLRPFRGWVLKTPALIGTLPSGCRENQKDQENQNRLATRKTECSPPHIIPAKLGNVAKIASPSVSPRALTQQVYELTRLAQCTQGPEPELKTASFLPGFWTPTWQLRRQERVPAVCRCRAAGGSGRTGLPALFLS